jgi:hypothetical protein
MTHICSAHRQAGSQGNDGHQIYEDKLVQHGARVVWNKVPAVRL